MRFRVSTRKSMQTKFRKCISLSSIKMCSNNSVQFLLFYLFAQFNELLINAFWKSYENARAVRRRFISFSALFTNPSSTFLKQAPIKAYSNTQPPANHTFHKTSKMPSSILLNRPRDRIKATTFTPKSTTPLRGDQEPSMDDIETTTPGLDHNRTPSKCPVTCIKLKTNICKNVFLSTPSHRFTATLLAILSQEWLSVSITSSPSQKW